MFNLLPIAPTPNTLLDTLEYAALISFAFSLFLLLRSPYAMFLPLLIPDTLSTHPNDTGRNTFHPLRIN